MRADQARDQLLLLGRETRHVGILEQIGAMPVIAVVGHIEADLMQPRAPGQTELGQRILESPGALDLRQER